MSKARTNISTEASGQGAQFPFEEPETRNPKLRTALIAYLRLARPANIVTAWADVLAGVAVSSQFAFLGMLTGHALVSAPIENIFWLLLATTGLYGGGVVFNDVFDAELDAVERPERPIPSGQASMKGAVLFGLVLLLGGILFAWQSSWQSGVLAACIAVAALIYDKSSKHHTFWGPVNMGLCRAMNLFMGLTIIPVFIPEFLVFVTLPLLYIGGITLISQGEVHGGTSTKGWLAVGFLGLVITILAFITVNQYYSGQFYRVLFPLFFVLLVAPPFIRAARKPDAPVIRKAVKAGILGLIPMNAAIASNFTSWEFSLLILLLLPISIGLGKLFALT